MPELGMPTDLQGLLEEAEQVQRRLVEAQAELARQEVSGSAGSGLVTARVNGTGELVSLSIDPRILHSGDPDRMAQAVADLVLAAVRSAERAAADLREQALAPFGDPFGAFELEQLEARDAVHDGGNLPADTRPAGDNARMDDSAKGAGRVVDSDADLDTATGARGRGEARGEVERLPSRAGRSRVPGRAAS